MTQTLAVSRFDLKRISTIPIKRKEREREREEREREEREREEREREKVKRNTYLTSCLNHRDHYYYKVGRNHL